jgi:hypothetical protein
VFAGALKYQWRSCESSRGHKSASRGHKICKKKGRERACIAHESATRGLEIVAETVRVFAGPFSYKWRPCECSRDHERANRGHKSDNKGHENAHSGRRSAQRIKNNVVEAVKVCRGRKRTRRGP